MSTYIVIILLLFLFLISYFLLLFASKGKILKGLIKKKPSDLNMHDEEIYQNAGVIVIGLFILSSYLMWIWLSPEIIFTEKIPRPQIFFLSLFLLYLMSVYDFIRKIHPTLRLFGQIIIVYISLSLINFPIIDINLIPLKVQYLSVLIFWVYVINITNFVDGLDGMIGTSILGVLITSIIFLILFKIQSLNFYIAITLMPFLFSFLIFNKPKAKIFLNDSGSVPLGYIMGFFLINFLQNEEWIFFFSVFSYFIIDVTITLIIKLRKGILPWVRMFDYFFLKPVLIGKKSHYFVIKYIFIYYLLMILMIYLIFYFKISLFFLLTYSILFSFFIIFIFNKFKVNKNNL